MTISSLSFQPQAQAPNKTNYSRQQIIQHLLINREYIPYLIAHFIGRTMRDYNRHVEWKPTPPNRSTAVLIAVVLCALVLVTGWLGWSVHIHL
jgi:hypothetical protein